MDQNTGSWVRPGFKFWHLLWMNLLFVPILLHSVKILSLLNLFEPHSSLNNGIIIVLTSQGSCKDEVR